MKALILVLLSLSVFTVFAEEKGTDCSNMAQGTDVTINVDSTGVGSTTDTGEVRR